METVSLTESTYNDAKAVVLDRFGEEALYVLDTVMKNPLRKLCADAGDIVYNEGIPVCFQACMLRRIYLKDAEIFGVVNGLTCLKNGAPPEAYIDVKLASGRPRNGSHLGFGNSQNAESSYAAERLAKKKNAKVFLGPDSCTRFLWRAVRPLECVAYFIRRKVFKVGLPQWRDFSTLTDTKHEVVYGDLSIKRLMNVESEFFDVLMSEYLKTNEGLVCSRTAEEIEWVFGERIRKGFCVALGAFKDGKPAGYIIARSKPDAKRWQILDWFAISNDIKVLESLLSELCVFLKRKTPAMMLESIGFPTYIQPLLKCYLPHERPIGHNAFSWGSGNNEFCKNVMPVIDTNKSWFFGPYDGDECLG